MTNYQYELIQPPVNDLGTAPGLAAVNTQVDSLQSQYGVFGSGMTVTDALIETDGPGNNRVFMQSSAVGPPGVYVEQSDNTVTAWLTPSYGLGILGGQGLDRSEEH